MNIGLRLRATLWSVGANGLALLVGTALTFWLLDQQLTGGLDEALTAQAHATAAAVETWIGEELRDESAPATAETIRALLLSPKLSLGLKTLFAPPTDAPAAIPTMTSLLDADGAVLLSTHSPAVLAPPDPNVLKAARTGSVHRAVVKIVSQEKELAFRVATVPVSAHGNVAAFIQVWGPVQPLRSTLNRVRTLLAFSVAALLLLNSWLVGVTLRRAFRPVDALVAEIHKITERNLSVRVPVPPARDEMRRLSETFNAMLDRLDRGFEFQTRLFQDLSHQLKTPLAILTGTLETALVRGRTVKEYRTILESSLDEVSRMTQLIEHLLLLARLDSQQLILQTTPMDFGEFCHSWVDDFALLLDAKGLKAEWQDVGRLPVLIDPARLGQALLNLLDNAVKHSPEDSRVVFRLFRTNTAAGLDLINFGPPFTPGSEERIFQRFFRETDGSAGFGLGLPIARAAVELHGGRLTAFSPPDGGAAFRLELPLAGLPPSSPMR